MLNYNSISLHRIPYSWGESTNIFTPDDLRSLMDTIPSDFYRTIDSIFPRPFHYDIRCMINRERGIVNDSSLSPIWKKFLNYLISPEYKKFISDISGIDVNNYIAEANFYKYSSECFMESHPDIPSKVVSHIFYFNKDWEERDGGCLCILKSNNENDVHAKVIPESGKSAIIIRSDTSFHSVEPSKNGKCRNNFTIAFYKSEATSELWVPGEDYPVHDNFT